MNDIYYTYNSGSNGYVVTDPPPTDESDASEGTYENTAPLDASSSSAGENGGGAEVYAYPNNGQSDEQQATDRYECHKWAVAQSGFDPTRSPSSGSPVDYRRAMAACLDGRGYTAK